MNFVKKNLKWIITIIGVIVITTGISVYATSQYLASQVDYKNGDSVEDALDDLYSKVPSGTLEIKEKKSNIDVSKYQYADTTGLYTADEVQSGKGTSWNYGNFDTETGTRDINIGFRPTEIYFEWINNSDIYLYHYINNQFFVIYRSTNNNTTTYNSTYINDSIEIIEKGFKIKGWGANCTISYIAR